MLHSSTGPSRYKLWSNCAAFREMSSLAPRDEDNFAAIEGRCGHAAGSKALAEGTQAVDYIGEEFEGLVLEKDIAEMVDEFYVNYVRQKIKAAQLLGGTVHFYNEQTIDLSWVHEKFFGTADSRIVVLQGNSAETIDLKLGRTVVDADEGQLDCYALDLMKTYPHLQYFHNTICQPRYPHRDGPIRTEVRTREYLEKFAEHAAEMQEKNYQNGQVATAGGHCTWCPSAGLCGAHAEFILSILPVQNLRVDVLSAEQVDNLLQHRKQIEVFMRRLSAYGTELVKRGMPMKTQKMVYVRPPARAEDTDPAEAARIIKMLTGKEVDLDVIAPRKLGAVSKLREQYGDSVAELFTKRGAETLTLVPITEKGTAVAMDANQMLLNTPIGELKK